MKVYRVEKVTFLQSYICEQCRLENAMRYIFLQRQKRKKKTTQNGTFKFREYIFFSALGKGQSYSSSIEDQCVTLWLSFRCRQSWPSRCVIEGRGPVAERPANESNVEEPVRALAHIALISHSCVRSSEITHVIQGFHNNLDLLAALNVN